MLVLGFQGSPRKKGNTSFLLSTFMQAAESLGAQTRIIDVTQKNIIPCKEYVVCEKKGFCPIDDDIKTEIYPLIRQAEVVVLASPIFFFNMTAQLKAVVDRCQLFWARKYKLKLTDPAKKTKRGFVLSVGASKGKNLFEGLQLTAKYFFDAIDARFEGSLTYREIEGPKDMSKHPKVRADVEKAAADLIRPLIGRKKILFASRPCTKRGSIWPCAFRKASRRRFQTMPRMLLSPWGAGRRVLMCPGLRCWTGIYRTRRESRLILCARSAIKSKTTSRI
jgi:multimeric flavodoxin WrbA